MTIEAVEVTAANRAVAEGLQPKPGQERFVSSVAESLRQAEQFGGGWPRLLLDDGKPVAFVMGGFGDEEPFTCVVWKLLVAAHEQGKGYGRAAVEVVADEARRRGHARLGVFFVEGPDGPEAFWLHLGFEKVDEPHGHEVRATRIL
jgi:diamine N-acetyltransferase